MTLAFDRRILLERALVAGLITCLASIGCSEVDPLEAIRQRQATGDLAGSIEPLRELLAERSDDPEANYLYGRALVATQQSGLATFALRKAMEDPEWTVVAGLQLAHSALASGDYNEVVEVAGRVLEREPENLSALLARAEAHAYWRKDLAQALADANRVLELDPDAIQAFEPRIVALLWLERIDEARAAIAELGRRIDEVDSPEGTRAWYCATSAIFTQESGELERAREIWSGCLAAHASSSEVVWTALKFYDQQGEPARSIDVLRAALADAPAILAYRTALADRLRQAGAVAEGEALLREATRAEDPKVAADAWLALGKFRLSAGERVAAAEAIEHAVERARDAGGVTPQLSFEYADALVLALRFDRALEVAEGLSVPAHRHLIRARVAQEKGDPAGALGEFSAGLRLWPDNPWARYYAARAAEDLGDFDRALEEYRTSIRIDPGATEARTRAARVLLAEGKPRFAGQLLRELQHKPLDAAGEMLALRLAGRFGTPEEIDAALSRAVSGDFVLSAHAVTEIAKGIAEGKAGPAAALALLRNAPGIGLNQPRNAVALRAVVRFSHEAGERATPPELPTALVAHPESGTFQEIRGLDLELSGAPAEAARAAYARALELEPQNAGALAGLGRLALDSDPAQALGYFDRAAAADPSDPEPDLHAARALVASGNPAAAAERLDALLEQHPLEVEAALLRASLDLERGVATDRTLERARRAVRFGGGVPALELLGRVHAKRGESEQAEKVAARARALREKGDKAASEG